MGQFLHAFLEFQDKYDDWQLWEERKHSDPSGDIEWIPDGMIGNFGRCHDLHDLLSPSKYTVYHKHEPIEPHPNSREREAGRFAGWFWELPDNIDEGLVKYLNDGGGSNFHCLWVSVLFEHIEVLSEVDPSFVKHLKAAIADVGVPHDKMRLITHWW